MGMGVPPSSVNCLVAAGFLPLAAGADAIRVPRPAAGMITTTFIGGCKYTRVGASVQIGCGSTASSPAACFILECNPMADSIHIKLPDGSVKDVPKGSTALDVAKSVGQRLADAALAAKTNGDLIDLTRPLEKDTDLRILTDRDPEALEV